MFFEVVVQSARETFGIETTEFNRPDINNYPQFHEDNFKQFPAIESTRSTLQRNAWTNTCIRSDV